MKKQYNRRDFIRTVAVTGVGLAVGGRVPDDINQENGRHHRQGGSSDEGITEPQAGTQGGEH